MMYIFSSRIGMPQLDSARNFFGSAQLGKFQLELITSKSTFPALAQKVHEITKVRKPHELQSKKLISWKNLTLTNYYTIYLQRRQKTQ